MSTPRPDRRHAPPSAARLRAMRLHYLREAAGSDLMGGGECPYVLELEASMAGLDELFFAYVVAPWALPESVKRAIEGEACHRHGRGGGPWADAD